MSDWVEAEPAECQRHDVRHAKRLARLLACEVVFELREWHTL
jgi:hypothetical protein